MVAVHNVETTDGNKAPVAIVCGGGTLPFAVASAVLRRGGSVFLLPIEGWADARAVAEYPHAWMKLGQFGRAQRLARNAGCRDVVCIGTLRRPMLRSMKLDWATLRMLPRLYQLYRGGDDRLLTGVGRLVEEHGFRLLGAHEVAPEILVPAGALSQRKPSAGHLVDAARGFALLETIGPFDVGQAAVVCDNRVLAIEAAEGTDAMLARVAELRHSGRIRLGEGAGVLVKASKPGQERRLDLPAIGPATVERVRDAGLAGIAVRAGEVVVAEPEVLIGAADKAGLFVVGLAASPERA
jgi:DUF1009 family protein